MGRVEGQKRGRAFAGVALLLLGLALAGPAVASNRSSSRAAALTSAIDGVMRRGSIPGAIVGVWRRGTKPCVKAFGVHDKVTRRRMSTDLYMRIGSETKTFTVTALLQLVDERKVRLDDTIGKYVAGVPDGNAITLRELAEMRSGLFDYLSNAAFLRAWFSHLRREWTPRQLLAYSFSSLVFAPGTRYDYVNANTVLLGLVVQKVSRQPVAVGIKQAHPGAPAPHAHQPPGRCGVPVPPCAGLHQSVTPSACWLIASATGSSTPRAGTRPWG